MSGAPALGNVSADPMTPAVGRIARRRRETRGTWTLDIEPPAGAVADGFAPGQFNMLYLPGIGEVPISISGDPESDGPIRHTVRAVGPVSTAITALRTGDAIGLRGPFGSAWPVEEAAGADVVVIAGGLGLAPLRPALYALFAARARYGKLALLYGTRSPPDILFRAELEAWRGRPDAEVEITVDSATANWQGNVGVVTKLLPRVAFDPDSTIALVCGPEVMMRFAAEALADAGVPHERTYLSMERNMKCAVGHCGHCQFGSDFVCKDGPVIRYDRLRIPMKIREM